MDAEKSTTSGAELIDLQAAEREMADRRARRDRLLLALEVSRAARRRIRPLVIRAS